MVFLAFSWFVPTRMVPSFSYCLTEDYEENVLGVGAARYDEKYGEFRTKSGWRFLQKYIGDNLSNMEYVILSTALSTGAKIRYTCNWIICN